MAFGRASDHGSQGHFSDYENTPYALGVDCSIAEQDSGNCFEEWATQQEHQDLIQNSTDTMSIKL